jgi:acyl-CoA reductase-like NAD-dependent aldehyde dehydrogenase
VALGALTNSGQICVAIKRIFVHESIYKDFMTAMVKSVQQLKVGPGVQEGVKIGPVQNGMQYEKVGEFFKDTTDHGYKFAYGGKFESSDGFFVQPALVDNPPTDSRIWSEEPFGKLIYLLILLGPADEDDRAHYSIATLERRGRCRRTRKCYNHWTRCYNLGPEC